MVQAGAGLHGLKPQVLVQGLNPQVFVQGLNPQVLAHGLKPQALEQGLKVQVVAQGLNPQVLVHGLKPQVLVHGLNPQAFVHGLKPQVLAQGLSPQTLPGATTRPPTSTMVCGELEAPAMLVAVAVAVLLMAWPATPGATLVVKVREDAPVPGGSVPTLKTTELPETKQAGEQFAVPVKD